MSYVSQEEIFKATDGGLDIILAYYPQAANCVGNNRKFKLRSTEKTASGTCKKLSDGNYVVTDFGGDGKPRNAIAVVMEEEACDFKTAIKLIADRWNIMPEERKVELLKPEIRQRDALPEEEDGIWQFEYDDYTEKDLRIIFSEQVIKYTQGNQGKGAEALAWVAELSKLCKKYYMHKLKNYSVIKARKVTTISSTEHYPIFVWEVPKDGKKIMKIYQPLSLDKGRRFIYYGGQPNDYIFGLKQCVDFYNSLNDEAPRTEKEEPRKEKKIPEIIMCTGGSDALNVAALSYQVVWLNSESAKLNGKDYHSIASKCERFCILPDIDATGKRTAHEMCMIYLDTRFIRLPEELAEKKDWRGNGCKDVRDYLKFWKAKDFDDVVSSALPYKFWDEVPQFNKKEERVGINYECNNRHLYWFLSQNGFYQYKNKNESDIFIQITGNTVKEVKPKDIRLYINKFLADRNSETKLINTFFRTTQLTVTSFDNLPYITIDFTDYNKDGQWMFFANKTWEVNKNDIIQYKPGEIKKYVWEKEVIPHRVDKLDDFFKISKDEVDEYQIEILNRDCLLFQFIINTCKMHWKVEELGVDDGNGGIRKTLTEEEKREQDLHLINHIYAMGYLLHKYKEPSSAYAVWAMENEVIEDTASEGRSGKSLCMKIPTYFLNSKVKPARDQTFTDNKHWLEGINEFTDYVLFDDCNEYLKFGIFFPMITGAWDINPKNTASYTLSEDDAPKMGFASNFSPRDIDGSTMDRLIFMVFSDYYHFGPSDKYAERRTPKTDFGKNLFKDFTDEEWNMALNLGAQLIKAYLSFDEKQNPPMRNVNQRQLLAVMTEIFKNWADVYFSAQLNKEVQKEEAMKDFFTNNNSKWSPQKFGKAIAAWCKFYGYKLNPKEKCNDGKRIVRNIEVPVRPGSIEMKKMSKEFIYIEDSQLVLSLDAKKTEGTPTTITDDLPF